MKRTDTLRLLRCSSFNTPPCGIFSLRRDKTLKKATSCALLIFLLTIYACAGCSSASGYEETFFGRDTYSETAHICTNEDMLIAEPILDEIESSFSYIGESDDCKEKFGALSPYCLTNSDAVSETHDIQFITAKTDGNCGYIWIRYSREGFDKDKHSVVGSWDILSRIKIEKTGDVWTAAEVKEHP